jgi:hypothetical protein
MVGERGVERLRVRIGVDGHRFDAHLAARTDHADGDLTTIGDQDF